MKKTALIFFLALALLTALPIMKAQSVPPALAKVAKAIECSRQESQFEWAAERVKPITGSENVLIEMYVSAGRRVKVSIVSNASESEAIQGMKRGRAFNKSAKEIYGLGDEAYSRGFSDDIAFRKGNLTVDVSAISDIDRLLPMLDGSERTNLRRTEEIAMNRNIAQFVANILSNLDRACQPMERI